MNVYISSSTILKVFFLASQDTQFYVRSVLKTSTEIQKKKDPHFKTSL